MQKKGLLLYLGTAAALVLLEIFLLYAPTNPLSFFSDRWKGMQRTDPQFLKLNQILDDHKDADLKVIYDGTEFTPGEFLGRAKHYLSRHFTPGTGAKFWVERHCYRTKKGNVIYFKYPDGSFRPMRDVFLQELRAAPASSEKANGTRYQKQNQMVPGTNGTWYHLFCRFWRACEANRKRL